MEQPMSGWHARPDLIEVAEKINETQRQRPNGVEFLSRPYTYSVGDLPACWTCRVIPECIRVGEPGEVISFAGPRIAVACEPCGHHMSISPDEASLVLEHGRQKRQFDAQEKCPHCDEPQPSRQMDAHVATVHADLPPCTARIEPEHGGLYTCAFRAGHEKGLYGRWHASISGEPTGRYVWNDSATGATPHTAAQGNVIPCHDRNPALTAKLYAPAPEDDRLRQAEIRAAVAEHEAEAYRQQVQALARELLRMRDVPEEDLPQKVRVIILHEEAP